MEKFNQAPTSAKVESDTIEAVSDSSQIIEDSSNVETTEEFTTFPGAFMNGVLPSPESAPESPSDKITRLRQQKNAATDHINSEFWPDELDAASIFRTRDLLRKQATQSGVETSNDEDDIPPRVRAAMEMNSQLNSIDSQIDQMYDDDPDLVESMVKEILAKHFTPDKLALAKNEGVFWRDHDGHPNTVPVDNEFQSLLSKYEKHKNYVEGQGVESPKFDFVEGYISQLAQERSEEITAYETLSLEEKERYSDKQTVREKLSYQDADLPPEQLEAMLHDAEGRDTAEQYAHHLNKLPQEEVERVLPQVKGLTKKVLSAIGIPISPYGESDSWVYWDLGKQQYYYERNKDSEPVEGHPYTYAPALEKLVEISDRHTGWEFYHAPAEARQKAFESIKDPYYLALVFDILQNDPKTSGQLPSHKYAELGNILREYARSIERNTDNYQIERQANYEGNDSELLFSRFDNPKILEQIVQIWQMGYNAQAGQTIQKVNEDENGHFVLEETQFVPPSEKEIRDTISDLINEIKTTTPISFDDQSPTSDNIGLFWKMPDGREPTLKQKSIAVAHEKGHRVRQFPGGTSGEELFASMFRKAIDSSRINYTQNQYERDLKRLQQSRSVEEDDSNREPLTFDTMKKMTQDYLARPEEIIERMAQLKNYFGFKDDEVFTQHHLDYARGHYINDTGMDNLMRHFFDSIIDDREFLKLINSCGV